MIHYRTVDSPIGALALAGRGRALTNLRMLNQTYEPDRGNWVRDDRAFPDAVDQLEAYFAGKRTDFDVELNLVGSEFQRRVWQALLTIPYGETRSYGQVAEQIGAAGAARAVGLANGHNPIAIIVPCHRVIGANGSLTGYGGGLDRKRSLLEMEKTVREMRVRGWLADIRVRGPCRFDEVGPRWVTMRVADTRPPRHRGDPCLRLLRSRRLLLPTRSCARSSWA